MTKKEVKKGVKVVDRQAELQARIEEHRKMLKLRNEESAKQRATDFKNGKEAELKRVKERIVGLKAREAALEKYLKGLKK